MSEENGCPVSDQRLLSLDALRGFDMLFILGVAPLIVNLCALAGWGESCWLARQMFHVEWDGLAHHDTIFPLFLFIAGVSFPFSFAKQLERGRSLLKIRLRILRRMVILCVLGYVYSGGGRFLPKDVGCLSVLARIGVSWALAAWLFTCCGWRTRAFVCAGVLIGYWALLNTVVAPDWTELGLAAPPSSLSPEGNVSGWFDRHWIPFFKSPAITPEIIAKKDFLSLTKAQSVLGNFSGMVTAMLGMFAGEFVKNRSLGWSGERKTLWMLGASVALLGAGVLFHCGLGAWSGPMNKKLWSTAFVLVVGAYSLVLFAAFHYLIDVKGWWGEKSSLVFRVVGMNSIFIYLASNLVSFQNLKVHLFGVFGKLALAMPASWGLDNRGWAVVILAAGYVFIHWYLCWFLYRKKIFFKV